jgi:hypothetical protein
MGIKLSGRRATGVAKGQTPKAKENEKRSTSTMRRRRKEGIEAVNGNYPQQSMEIEREMETVRFVFCLSSSFKGGGG